MADGTRRAGQPTGSERGPGAPSVKPPLRDHPRNDTRKNILTRVRNGLSDMAGGGDAKKRALRLLDTIEPTSGLASWVRLRDELASVDSDLEYIIAIECELVHISTLNSVTTLDDLLPAIRSVCTQFMDAYVSSLDSWKSQLRDLAMRLDDGAGIGSAAQNYVADMVRFGSRSRFGFGFGDDVPVAIIDELCIKRGQYGDVFAICHKIMDFDYEDAQCALASTVPEASIERLAKHAIAQRTEMDPKIAKSCSDILARRIDALGVDIAIPRDGALAPEAISRTARVIMERRLQHDDGSRPSAVEKYPFRCAFSKFPESKPPQRGSIHTEQEARRELDLVVKRLGRVRIQHIGELRSTLSFMLTYVSKDVTVGEATKRHILDMARFGSGIPDEFIDAVMTTLYLDRSLYGEACDICGAMVDFGGADSQRIAASRLPESIIGIILAPMERCRPENADSIVRRCGTILEQRSGALGLGLALAHYHGDALKSARELEFDIMQRRRVYSADELNSWILDQRPLSHGFLHIEKHIGQMVASKSDLARHISAQMGIYRQAQKQNLRYYPNGALEELETTLKTMKKLRIDPKLGSKPWTHGIRASELWKMLLEINLYAHCASHFKNIKPCPTIADRGCLDLLVEDCYIEAYFPLDLLLTTADSARLDAASIPDLCCRIMDKKQIEYFTGEQSILAVECDWGEFYSKDLRKLLHDRLQRRPGLGGILLVKHVDMHYNTFFIRNDCATTPLPPDTIDRICLALQTELDHA